MQRMVIHTVIGHLITENGTGGGIHDQTDISFDAAQLDAGFIHCENAVLPVKILNYREQVLYNVHEDWLPLRKEYEYDRNQKH